MNRVQAQKNFRREMRRMHQDVPSLKVSQCANVIEETVWMLFARGSDPSAAIPSLGPAIEAWKEGLESPLP